ncbi:MAG: lipopolysaccharide transport periplasmic protein LptA [Proteobacteria bacterium]|nr:lipopolysaccharide transport periplasmic protein LptA [Pseudomonadota bacterium]
MGRILLMVLMMCVAQTAHAQVKGPSIRDKPVDVQADKLEVDQEKQEATFSGNVRVEQANLRLAADKLTVYYAADGGNEVGQAVRKIVADGEAVTVVYAKDTATGKQAVYDVEKSEVVLDGGVVLVRGGNTLKGDKLVFNLTTGKVSLLSSGSQRVRAQFTPKASKK